VDDEEETDEKTDSNNVVLKDDNSRDTKLLISQISKNSKFD